MTTRIIWFFIRNPGVVLELTRNIEGTVNVCKSHRDNNGPFESISNSQRISCVIMLKRPGVREAL